MFAPTFSKDEIIKKIRRKTKEMKVVRQGKKKNGRKFIINIVYLKHYITLSNNKKRKWKKSKEKREWRKL